MNPRPFLFLTICLAVLAFALSLYVWQLRGGVQPETTPPAVPQPARISATAPARQVTLWVAHDDPGVLRVQGASMELSSERQDQAEEILRALLAIYAAKDSPHPLPAGAEVRNVYFVDPGLVVVDLNSELAAGQTSGVLAEELTIASFVQTLSANIQGISRVKFLVDGKQADTLAGHADLTAIYEASHVFELVKQLSE